MEKDTQFAEQLGRIYRATQTQTQADLAAYLGVRQSTISCAKRRANIPADWLLTLLLNNNVNPAWILSGKGRRYLDASVVERPEGANSALPRGSMLHIVRQLPSRMLADELVRRISECKYREGGREVSRQPEK